MSMLFESDLFYTMVAYDVLVVMPPKLQNILDTRRWPKDLNKRANLGANAPRAKGPIMRQLHPLYEESVRRYIDPNSPVEDHYFDVETKEGNLIACVNQAMGGCKASLSAFMHGKGGWEPAVLSAGQLVHRLIDIWNPLSLQDDDQLDDLRPRFMHDLEKHVYSLPFWWTAESRDVIEQTPYLDRLATETEAIRRKLKMLKPLADRYVMGNGYPAAEVLIKEWYNTTVNAIARALLFCAI